MLRYRATCFSVIHYTTVSVFDECSGTYLPLPTSELAEMVKLAFHSLVENSYIMRHTNRPSTAGGESSDGATLPTHPPAVAAFTPLPEPLLQGVLVCVHV